MEDDPGDGSPVSAQLELLWRPRDPLGGWALLACWRPGYELLLRLRQLGLKLVYLDIVRDLKNNLKNLFFLTGETLGKSFKEKKKKKLWIDTEFLTKIKLWQT